MEISSEERLAATGDGALLLYDYFKHMTTLALVTLGGILAIPQSIGTQMTVRELLPSLGLIALSGAFSLYAMEAIIKSRLESRPLPKAMRWNRLIVGGTFGIGVGAFLGLFMDLIQ